MEAGEAALHVVLRLPARRDEAPPGVHPVRNNPQVVVVEGQLPGPEPGYPAPGFAFIG